MEFESSALAPLLDPGECERLQPRQESLHHTRAQLLEQTVARMNPSATAEAAREVEDLQQIAKEAQELFDKVLADIRARGADAGSVG